MKKIMTFAMMALFLGFAFTANAQTPKTARPANPKAATPEKTVRGDETTNAKVTEDWDTTIKNYEQAVDKCVALFKEMQNESGRDRSKEFEASLKKAENLKATIEKSKDELSRTQVDRFNKANLKLAQVYKKG